MYLATYNGQILHDPRVDDARCLTLSLTLEANAIPTLAFSIAPTHPLYGTMEAMNPEREVRLFDDGEELFRGRIKDDGQDMDTCTSFDAEGQLAYLCDSKVRAYGTYAATPDSDGNVSWSTIAPDNLHDYAEWLVSQSNATLGGSKTFSIGVNQLSTAGIVRSSTETPTTWSELSDKVLDSDSIRIRTRSIGDRRIIDFLTEGRVCGQTIEFGSNLLDFSTTRDVSSIITAVIPTGSRTVESGDSTTTETFDISTVADGPCANGYTKHGDRIQIDDGVMRWGIIEDSRSYDAQTVDGLVTSVCNDLASSSSVVESVSITAVDLNKVDASVDHIELLDMVMVSSKPHGISQRMECIKADVDALDPTSTKYTLGADVASLTHKNVLRTHRAESMAQQAVTATTAISAEAKAAANSAVTSVTTYYSSDGGATWTTTQPTG